MAVLWLPSIGVARCSALRRPRLPSSSSKSMNPWVRWRIRSERKPPEVRGRVRLAVLNLRARISELGLRCDLSARRTLYPRGMS